MSPANLTTGLLISFVTRAVFVKSMNGERRPTDFMQANNSVIQEEDSLKKTEDPTLLSRAPEILLVVGFQAVLPSYLSGESHLKAEAEIHLRRQIGGNELVNASLLNDA